MAKNQIGTPYDDYDDYWAFLDEQLEPSQEAIPPHSTPSGTTVKTTPKVEGYDASVLVQGHSPRYPELGLVLEPQDPHADHLAALADRRDGQIEALMSRYGTLIFRRLDLENGPTWRRSNLKRMFIEAPENSQPLSFHTDEGEPAIKVVYNPHDLGRKEAEILFGDRSVIREQLVAFLERHSAVIRQMPFKISALQRALLKQGKQISGDPSIITPGNCADLVLQNSVLGNDFIHAFGTFLDNAVGRYSLGPHEAFVFENPRPEDPNGFWHARSIAPGKRETLWTYQLGFDSFESFRSGFTAGDSESGEAWFV